MGQNALRVRWAAIGAAIAVSLGGGVVLIADAATPAAPSTFVPIVPCRLADTRPGTNNVGTRSTPLAGGEAATLAVWGTNGNCTIPSTATGIASNVTAVNATASGFLTLFPADASQPLTSNLNTSAGAPPTPNQVTVGLSAAGAIKVFNNAGTVDVIIDIVGYYQAAGAGSTGPRGQSAWDTIPSGQTVTGVNGFAGTYPSDRIQNLAIPLPGKAPVALTTGNVNIASDIFTETTDDDATCTGTSAAPTAPRGKVCIYPYFATYSDLVLLNGASATQLPTDAFFVAWQMKTPATSTQLFFTWAYTAP